MNASNFPSHTPTSLSLSLSPVIVAAVAISLGFLVWIFCALYSTMRQLRDESQTRKLERFQRLRTVFVIFTVLAAGLRVYAAYNTYSGQSDEKQDQNDRTVEALGELNYLFILVSVAYMWRPNPNAKVRSSARSFVLQRATRRRRWTSFAHHLSTSHTNLHRIEGIRVRHGTERR